MNMSVSRMSLYVLLYTEASPTVTYGMADDTRQPRGPNGAKETTRRVLALVVGN
jgi:hypothetical protein